MIKLTMVISLEDENTIVPVDPTVKVYDFLFDKECDSNILALSYFVPDDQDCTKV